jgi:ADP-dependent NAD(P)H-hydrate dehydratase
MRKKTLRAHRLDAATLRRWPLPLPRADGDKDARGRILVIGGSRSMPGAVILAANAALRAGAGKLAIATVRSTAVEVAVAVPESRVMGLAEARTGWIAPGAARSIDIEESVDAVLVGPGMENDTATGKFVHALLPRAARVPKATLVLDARALCVVGKSAPVPASAFAQPVIMTPNAGEMARLSGDSKEAIEARPLEAARRTAEHWNAVVVLKGATTVIAAPDGRLWRHRKPNTGLAVSGSGDTLAGIVGGLAARGIPPEQAAAWGVVLHALAGEALARRFGRLGYLARELPAEIPRLMSRLR